MTFWASAFLSLNSFICSLTFCFRTSYFPKIYFFNLLSSSLNSLWWLLICKAASFSSWNIFSPNSFISSFIPSSVSFIFSLTPLISTPVSNSLVLIVSVSCSTSHFNLSLTECKASLTLTTSSSNTLKVLPTHERSGRLSSLTHSGKLGILDLTLSICSQIAAISAS